MTEESEGERRRQFAAHLDYLFAAHLRPDGLPYTLHDVGRATGFAVTYLQLLRNQRIRELPEQARRERLACFFGVPATFFDEPLPDDAPEVMARHREKIVAVLQVTHVQKRPLGTPLDLSEGEQVQHLFAYALKLMDERSHEKPAMEAEPPLPEHEGCAVTDHVNETPQAAQPVPSRQAPWWRRLFR
jgi:hypothetical protein